VTCPVKEATITLTVCEPAPGEQYGPRCCSLTASFESEDKIALESHPNREDGKRKRAPGNNLFRPVTVRRQHVGSPDNRQDVNECGRGMEVTPAYEGRIEQHEPDCDADCLPQSALPSRSLLPGIIHRLYSEQHLLNGLRIHLCVLSYGIPDWMPVFGWLAAVQREILPACLRERLSK